MTGARYSPGLSVPSQVMPNAQRRPRTAIVAVPVLLVVVTFLFWYQTWFGSRLSNREIGEYLADTSVPHKTQHALAQTGTVKLVGTDTGRIVRETVNLLDCQDEYERMSRIHNPYGDGHASERIEAAIRDDLKIAR